MPWLWRHGPGRSAVPVVRMGECAMKAAWEWLTSLPKWWLIPAVACALGVLWAFLRPHASKPTIVPKPPQSADEVEAELQEATDAIEDSRTDALDSNPFRKP